ncbi:MAG: hypothetical protein GY754_32230 [bacterium]|nr:hypothetical protein [bacterium]
MKKSRPVLMLIVLLAHVAAAIPGFSQSKSTVVIDTPTAYTIGRGTYKVSFLGYDNGGVELKTVIGLHDNIYLGISFDVQNLIDKDTPKPNVPGVIARIKICDSSPPFPPAIAIGYDSFYSGQEGRTENPQNVLNRMIYGPYLAFTSPIYLFDSQQFVSYGIRLPVQPVFEGNDTSYFLALDIPMGESFRFKTEIERVYWNFQRNDDWLLNFGIRYSYMDHLGIEFDLMFQQHENPNRMIRIEYHDEF